MKPRWDLLPVPESSRRLDENRHRAFVFALEIDFNCRIIIWITQPIVRRMIRNRTSDVSLSERYYQFSKNMARWFLPASIFFSTQTTLPTYNRYYSL